MGKYQSIIVAPEEFKVEVLRREDATSRRIERVKLIHLPSGIEITKENKSQLDAYNAALTDLEIQVGISSVCDNR